MKRAMYLAWAFVVLGQGIAVSGLKEVEKGVFVDDFEDGTLDGWKVEASHVEVEKEGKNSVLELGENGSSPSKVLIKDKLLTDFSLEVRVRKQHWTFMDLGITFRNGCQVVFRRRPGLLVVLTPDGKGVARAYQAGFILDQGYRRLKVVCAGPVVRVFVDGQQACQFGHLPVQPGTVALYTSQGRAYFDDVRLHTSVPAEEYVDLEPQVADPCLVFPPDRPLTLNFKVSNYAALPQQFQAGLAVKTWDERPVKDAAGREIRVAPGGSTTVAFDLGPLAQGYYKMVLAPSGKLYPLAIQHRGSGQHEPPVVNLGVYWYYQIRDMEPIWKYTYTHAAARDLKAHGFNTAVMMVGEQSDLIDILASYGVFAITRGGGEMALPGVIGTFVGDEPHTAQEIAALKKQYLKIREASPNKLITTNIVCDGGISSFQQDAWKELAPIGGLRVCRWYNMKKCYFGPDRRYGQRPSFAEFAGQARAAHASPYWTLINTFGPDKLGPEDYYGFPTGPQVKAAMHLTFAYGGKGLVCFTYQAPWAAAFETIGLVQSHSLIPFGNVWEVAGEAALTISRHAKLIGSLKGGGAGVWCDKREIEVAPLQDSEGNPYFYAVNTDAVETVSFRLMNLDPRSKLVDLYAGSTLDINPEVVELYHGAKAEMGVVRLTLKPGDGKLLRYTAPRPTPGPRVRYPAWVEKVPEEKCQYLMNLTAANTPRPGWVPKRNVPWETFNGDTMLYTSKSDSGQTYKKSLYAHAETEIVYDLPTGYDHFVAAAGFGNPAVDRGSVVFRVLVDGKEKYRSDVYRLGQPILPVVVNIEGAKRLELVTEEAGDGLSRDYVWWGDARLVKR